MQSARCRADRASPTERASRAGRARLDHESGERHRASNRVPRRQPDGRATGWTRTSRCPRSFRSGYRTRDIPTKSSTLVSRVTRLRVDSAGSIGRSTGDVRILVIELGANDGLRGLPVNDLKRNLAEIITRAQATGHQGGADRHGSAAELRLGVHLRVPPGLSRAGDASTT